MIYKPFLSVKDTSVNMKSERRTMEPQTRNVKEITTQTETESLHYCFLPVITVSHSVSKLPRGEGLVYSLMVDQNSTIIVSQTKALFLAKSNLLLYKKKSFH